MIRFAWLRFRTQALVAFGVLAVLAVVLVVTGIRLAHAYDAAVAACKLHGDCASALSLFPSNGYLTASNELHPLVIAIPCVLGMFWGAPLAAREFETGTFRLAWTQGSTRIRWLAVKLAVVGAASVAVAGLLSLMVTWWSSPIAAAQMGVRLDPGIFAEGGIAPVGYAAFAFAFGVTAGLLSRRTLPAMAVTLGIFVAVWFAFPVWCGPTSSRRQITVPLMPPRSTGSKESATAACSCRPHRRICPAPGSSPVSSPPQAAAPSPPFRRPGPARRTHQARRAVRTSRACTCGRQ